MKHRTGPPDSPLGHAAPPNEPATLAPTPRTRSWLWPAVGLVVVLASLVAVAKLGQTPSASSGPAATAPPAATAVALRSFGPGRRPVFGALQGLIGAPTDIRYGGQRYVDGIPAVILGNDVVRVRDAAALPIDTNVLVGGWQRRADCTPDALDALCPVVLSDVPYRSSRAATLVALGQLDLTGSSEPRIYSAVVEADPDCSRMAAGSCLPRLIVDSALWVGDAETGTTPLDAANVLDSITSRFTRYDFHPFEEATSCPVTWPVQSYVVSAPDIPRADWTSLPVRVVVVFPSVEDRVAAESALRQSAAKLTPFEASNRCVAIPGGVDDAAWVVRDNVMVLLGPNDPDVREEVESALDAGPAAAS